MRDLVLFLMISALVVVLALVELLAAVVPLLIVVSLVPPEERAGLAELIATVDSRRRLRLWPALRLAVRARRSRAARKRSGPGPMRSPAPAGRP